MVPTISTHSASDLVPVTLDVLAPDLKLTPESTEPYHVGEEVPTKLIETVPEIVPDTLMSPGSPTPVTTSDAEMAPAGPSEIVPNIVPDVFLSQENPIPFEPLQNLILHVADTYGLSFDDPELVKYLMQCNSKYQNTFIGEGSLLDEFRDQLASGDRQSRDQIDIEYSQPSQIKVEYDPDFLTTDPSSVLCLTYNTDQYVSLAAYLSHILGLNLEKINSTPEKVSLIFLVGTVFLNFSFSIPYSRSVNDLEMRVFAKNLLHTFSFWKVSIRILPTLP